MPTSPSPTRVGVAVIEHDGRYLVGVRDADATLAGMAEFPGGKCRAEESPAACAVRETEEETGLRVSIDEPFFNYTYGYAHGTVELHFFLCRPDEPARADMRGFAWVEAARLPDLDFPPANEPVIRKLLDRQAGNSSATVQFG